MSKDVEMKEAQETNEEKKDVSSEELSKPELEKLALEGKSTAFKFILLLNIIKS